MANLQSVPGVASYPAYDDVETGFKPELIERAEQPSSATASSSYPKQSGKDRWKNGGHADRTRTEARIDLTDPAEVAEAVARFVLVNDSLHVMAAEKVRLEARLVKKREQIAALKAELATTRNDLKTKEEVLSYAEKHLLVPLVPRLLKGAAFGAAATTTSLFIIGYLF